MNENQIYYEDIKYSTIKLFDGDEEYEYHSIDDIIECLKEKKQMIPDGYLNDAFIDHNDLILETYRPATEEETAARIQKDMEMDARMEQINRDYEMSEYYRIREKYSLGERE